MFFRTKGDFLRITLEDKVFGIRLVTGGENALYFELLEKIVEGERPVWIVDEIDEPIGGLDGGGSFGQNLAVRLLGGDRSAGGFPVGKRDGEACDQGQKALLAGDTAHGQVVVAQCIIGYNKFDLMLCFTNIAALEKMSRDEFIGADDRIVAAGETADGLRDGR